MENKKLQPKATEDILPSNKTERFEAKSEVVPKETKVYTVHLPDDWVTKESENDEDEDERIRKEKKRIKNKKKKRRKKNKKIKMSHEYTAADIL